MLRAVVSSSFVRRTGSHVNLAGKWNQTQAPVFQNLSRNFWFGGNNDNSNDGSDNKKKDAKKKKVKEEEKEEKEEKGKGVGPEKNDAKDKLKEQKATVFKTDDDTNNSNKGSTSTTVSTLLPTKLSFGDDSPRYPHLTALPVITRPLFPGIVSSVTLTDPVGFFHDYFFVMYLVILLCNILTYFLGTH